MHTLIVQTGSVSAQPIGSSILTGSGYKRHYDRTITQQNLTVIGAKRIGNDWLMGDSANTVLLTEGQTEPGHFFKERVYRNDAGTFFVRYEIH